MKTFSLPLPERKEMQKVIRDMKVATYLASVKFTLTSSFKKHFFTSSK